MSSISSIDTSIYSGLIESLSTNSGRNSSANAVVPTSSSSDVESTKVDLSNYYSNLQSADLLTQLGENVGKSAEDLNNAMISAMESGFSVQDVCNIKSAQAAYQANCTVLKSTFELKI